MNVLALAFLALSALPSGANASTYEWRPWNSNPAYEVYGRMEGGVFRWHLSRPKGSANAAPVRADGSVDWGVTLEDASASKLGVRGTATELGRELMEKTLEADPTGRVGETDIGQQCRQPELDPLRALEDLSPLPSLRAILAGVVLVGLIALVGFVVVCGILVTLIRKRS